MPRKPANPGNLKKAGPAPEPSNETGNRKIRARRSQPLSSAPAPKDQWVDLPADSPSRSHLALALPGERESALRRLGLHVLPFRVNMNAVLDKVGGFFQIMENVVPLVASSGDARYKKLVQVFRLTTPADRHLLYPEDYLYAADINPADFIGEVARIQFRLSMDVGTLLAAQAHPQIVEQSLAMAQTPIGIKDREFHFKSTGYLPLPKGAQINIQNNVAQVTAPGQQDMALPAFESDALEDTHEVDSEVVAEDAEFEDLIDAQHQPPVESATAGNSGSAPFDSGPVEP